MNYRSALVALMIFGSMAVYAEAPTKKPEVEKANPDVEKIIGEIENKAPSKKDEESSDKDKKPDDEKADHYNKFSSSGERIYVNSRAMLNYLQNKNMDWFSGF